MLHAPSISYSLKQYVVFIYQQTCILYLTFLNGKVTVIDPYTHKKHVKVLVLILSGSYVIKFTSLNKAWHLHRDEDLAAIQNGCAANKIWIFHKGMRFRQSHNLESYKKYQNWLSLVCFHEYMWISYTQWMISCEWDRSSFGMDISNPVAILGSWAKVSLFKLGCKPGNVQGWLPVTFVMLNFSEKTNNRFTFSVMSQN